MILLSLTGIGWKELPIERTGDLDGRPLLNSGPVEADEDDDDDDDDDEYCEYYARKTRDVLHIIIQDIRSASQDGEKKKNFTSDVIDAARDVIDAARDVIDAARDVIDAARDVIDAARDVIDAARDVIDAARDVIDAARDVMDAVRDVIPVACEALPSKMLLLLWLRSIPCFNATAATREALVS
ncbi:hypothetical protein GQR58_018518 [Nymphon striatum]|nr:hypothetical protein GQR58_018518 [Nymphon striatum]